MSNIYLIWSLWTHSLSWDALSENIRWSHIKSVRYTKSDVLRNAGISVFAVKHFMTMICDTAWLAHITCEILQSLCNFTFTSVKLNSAQCSITALIHSNLELFSPRKNYCEARWFIQNTSRIQKKISVVTAYEGKFY